MEKNSLLTIFKNNRIFILIVLLLLSGCNQSIAPIDHSSTGLFDHYLVYPFSLLIKYLANLFRGNYGISIIIMTLAIRFILLPFMVTQMKQSKMNQEKMKDIKPEMNAIREKYKTKRSTEDQLSMHRELSELYKKHDFNPMKTVTGCLPIIIQMPFLIAFYYAIRRTPEIAEHSFLWFSLGETDLLLVILAVITYYIQSKVSLMGLEKEQRQQMAVMGILSPILIGVISLTTPAALPLYWTVSALFMIIPTVLVKTFITKV